MTELDPMRLHHHRESEPEHLLQRAQHLQAGPGLGYECADFLTDIATYLAAQQGLEIKEPIGVQWQKAETARRRDRDLPDFSLPASDFKDYREGGGGTLGSPQKCIRQDCDCFDTWNCSRPALAPSVVAEPTIKLCSTCGGIGFLEAAHSDHKFECPECSGTGRSPSPHKGEPAAWRYRDSRRDGSKWTVQKNKPDWAGRPGWEAYAVEPLYAAPPPMEGMDGTRVVLIDREDGGLRVWSPDLPGLILSGADPARVASAIPAAIKGLREYAATPNHPEPGADHDRD